MKTPANYSTPMGREVPPTDISCWEYYKQNTDQYGDISYFSFHGREHTRNELKNDVEALAAFLKEEFDMGSDKAGIGNQKVAAVLMPTNAESVISFMALNKIGAITYFIHPLLPYEKLRHLIKVAGATCLITLDVMAEKYKVLAKELKLKTLMCMAKEYAYEDKADCPDEHGSVKSYKDEGIQCVSFPDVMKRYSGKSVKSIEKDKKYIGLLVNGGGTTGSSKTIILSNLALNGVTYNQCWPNIPVTKPGYETELVCMPFFHMFGFAVGGLCAMNKGVRVIFMPKFDADEFVKNLKANYVVEFNGVPNMYKKLIAHPDFDGPHLKNITTMFAGGDYVSNELTQAFYSILRKHGSKAEFCQGYGLTECCAVCTANPVYANKPGTIGRGIPGIEIQIWDEDKKEVPFGQVGEIAISGITVMEGYLKDDGTTDPGVYVDEEGTRWVLTGDLGKMDEEGYITFSGRKKRLVVISGYNVYPLDIEFNALDTGLLEECCAVEGYDEDGKILIRLFAVPKKKPLTKSEKEETDIAIRDIISRRLSKFNIPRDIRYVDKLPRTKLEKIDFVTLTQSSPEDSVWEG